MCFALGIVVEILFKTWENKLWMKLNIGRWLRPSSSQCRFKKIVTDSPTLFGERHKN